MNFALPIAFAWAALALPIVIFYILKIRLRRVPVSTTIFWRQIFDEKQPRSLWQQLRHWLSLLAQILLLLLFVLALTDPYFRWEILQARRLVLVVDNSASMNASDVLPTRLARAKQIAEKSIAGLRMRDEMAIVVAGTEPQVLCGMTNHQRTLHDKLTELSPSDGPTRVRDAVALARRLIGDHPRGRVILLTDGCFSDSSGDVTTASDVELHTVGSRTGNIGLTRWQARRSLIDPLGYEILVEVFNASDSVVECRLEIDLDNLPVDVIPLKLERGQVWKQTFEKTSVNGGKLVARLKHDDPLAIDNTAWAILPKRERQKVVLITAGNHFLAKAVEANQLVDLTIAADFPGIYDSQTIYFFHRKTPQQLPHVSMFVIDPANSCDRWTVGEKLSNPIVTKQDQDSVLMRHVRLDNVLMPDARQLQPAEPMQTLVQALSGDPLFAALERPQGKILVLTVNLDEGDLTFRTAFPILVTNALAWFSGQSGELRESLAAGETTHVELPQSSPAASSGWMLRSPAGEQRQLSVAGTKAIVGPLDLCGVWSLSPRSPATASQPRSGSRQTSEGEIESRRSGSRQTSDGEIASRKSGDFRYESVELACNLANREETDLRTPEVLLNRTVQTPLAAGIFTRPVWFYLIVLAWLLATAEWWLYQRRWVG